MSRDDRVREALCLQTRCAGTWSLIGREPEPSFKTSRASCCRLVGSRDTARVSDHCRISETPVSVLNHLRESRGRAVAPLGRSRLYAVACELRLPGRARAFASAPGPSELVKTMMYSEDLVEVWLASGKKYCGRIVDLWPADAGGHGSIVLCEDDQVYVLIHRVQVRRIDHIGPVRSGTSIAESQAWPSPR